MRALDRLGRTVGILALAASALLASPGVEAVRAEGPAGASAAAPAEQCRESRTARQADLDAFLAQLRREHGARLAAEADAQGIIVLNGRGYNYASQPGPSSILLPPEIRR